jgi:hypothetical protein
MTSAQTPDERASARAVVLRHGDAVVTVIASVRVRTSMSGQPAMPADEQQVRASATVLDAGGLVVTALSAVDPSEMFNQMSAAAPGAGRARPEMTTEAIDVRIRLAAGSEAPARIVLRARDEDLLFVRLASAPVAPLAVAGPAAARPELLVSLHRFGPSLGFQVAASLGHVRAVADKPRAFYAVSSVAGDSALGGPVFDLAGRFLGVVAMRATGDTLGGPDAIVQPVVVPARDILEIARKAK